MSLKIIIPKKLKVKIRTKINTPIDLEKTTAESKDVLLGKTFYSKTKIRQIGTLVAYDVQEEILGNNESRLVITKLTTKDTPDADEKIMKDNINVYKMQDLTDIAQNGGELATDEEYANAELELQNLYEKIMIGGIK